MTVTGSDVMRSMLKTLVVYVEEECGSDAQLHEAYVGYKEARDPTEPSATWTWPADAWNEHAGKSKGEDKGKGKGRKGKSSSKSNNKH